MAADQQRWRLGEGEPFTASQVAAALVRREAGGPITYRGVALAVDAQEVRAAQLAQLYRVVIVDVVSWPELALPTRCRRPQRWTSEVLPVDEELPGTLAARLQDFETSFALRTFLYRVAADIDGVFNRAEKLSAAWARRRGEPAKER
jgi:hypothetical protein